MTLSDAGTTASGHSGSTSGTGKRTGTIFKIGKRSKKNKEKDPYYGHGQAESISSPQNVKHELHVDGGLTGFPPEWEASLLQLGYTREELDRMVMDRQRRNLSAAHPNLIPLGGNLTQPSHAGPSTSALAAASPIRYPSPPQQYALPVNPQLYQQTHSIAAVQHPAPALQTLKLTTDILPGQGSASNSPAQFAPSLRSIPDRVASPASSTRSHHQSPAGSDPRSSPVPSLSRERDQYFPPSNLSKEIPISTSSSPKVTESPVVTPPIKQAPTRPAPPPPLFSDRANTYKPPRAIAIQGDDDDDDDTPLQQQIARMPLPPAPSKVPSEQNISVAPREAPRPISGENNVTPTKATAADTVNLTPSASDSVPSPNTATPLSLDKAPRISLNTVPRISLSLGLGDLSKGLDVGTDAGKRESVAWSDAIFSALPSATAFDGFRSSISPKTLSGKNTPISARSPAGDIAAGDKHSPNSVSANVSPVPTATSSLLSTPSPLDTRPSPGPPKLELTSGFSPLSAPFSSTSSITQRLSPSGVSALPSPQPSIFATTSARDTLDFGEEAYAIAGLEDHSLLGREGDLGTPSSQHDRGSVVSRSSTVSGGSFASSEALSDNRNRMIRDSVSSYGALDEEDAEPVIVTRATAIKLARAPSKSLQRTLDTMGYRQNPSSSGSPPPAQGSSRGVVGQASAQMVTMHGRGASASSLLNIQTPNSFGSHSPASSTVTSSTDTGVPYGFSMYQYNEEDEHEDESDEEEGGDSSEEDEDPGSRNTIRLDDVKANRLMAAVMQAGGVVDTEDAQVFQNSTRVSPTASRPAAAVSAPAQDVQNADGKSRPLSTATIQTIRAESPQHQQPRQLGELRHQARPPTEYEDTLADDEDTSALDDWLEANEEIDDEQTRDDSDVEDDASPVPTTSRDPESSDYDDADHPLQTPSTSYSKGSDAASQSTQSSRFTEQQSLNSTHSPVQSPLTNQNIVDLPSKTAFLEATSPGQKSVSSAPSTGHSGFPQSPSNVSSPPQSSSRASFRQSRRFSKYSGLSSYSPLPGSASKSEFSSPTSQYRQNRSSIIYAPSLPSVHRETSLSTGSNYRELSPLSQPSASPDPPYSAMSLVDEATSKLLEPVAEFVLPGDPRHIFGEMHLVAEGESGGIFAAKVLGDAGTPVTSTSNWSRTTSSSISSLIGSVVAIKRMRVCDETGPRIKTLQHELSVLSACGQHANILTYGGMWLGNDPYVELWLQMELMERSLADLIALFQEGLSIEERHVARFAYDAACGLAFLEEAWIAHRDIRSDNLLVCADDGSVKIADFASAVQLSVGDTIRSDPAGIIYWQAPEMRKGVYDASKVDVWSLGATVWELVEGETPFEREEMSPTERLPELSNVQNVSQGLLGFLALCERPAKRRVAAKALLETPFVLARCSQEEMMQLLGRARALEQAGDLE